MLICADNDSLVDLPCRYVGRHQCAPQESAVVDGVCNFSLPHHQGAHSLRLPSKSTGGGCQSDVIQGCLQVQT